MTAMKATLPLFGAWAALMGLLAATIAASYVFTGAGSVAASLGIAFAKATLIYLFFMNFRRETGLLRLAGIAAVIWLAILLFFIAADYWTRR
jgi:cytochrome c oxidase subunit 4